MSTEFINDQWRLPNNENKDKQSNYSMDFDGSSYITCNQISKLNSTTAFSISVWCKLDNVSGIWGDYVSNIGIKLDWNDHTGGFLQFTTKTTGSNNYLAYNVARDSNWHHIVCTYDAGVRYIYLDGVSVANDSAAPTQMISTLGDNFLIGKHQQPTSMAGQIDGVSIFDYALSSSQVTTLYGSSSTGIGNPMSLSPKPVAYYPLGDQDAFNGAEYLTPNASLKDFVFDFDSGNDRISIPEFTFSGEFTLSMWINPSTIGSITYIIGRWNGNYDNDIRLWTANNTPVITFRIGGSAMSFYGYETSSTIPLNKWSNLSIIRNSSNDINCYLNGVQFSNYTGNSTNTLTLDSIGRVINTNSSSGWDGLLSNIQFFNTALPTTGSNSVETLYNNGSPLTSMTGFTSLVSWWKLDASDTYDGTNWTIEDHAGSNDGTSSGMTQANLVQSDLSFTSGYSPYALDFDAASSDYISAPVTTLNSATQCTISFWGKKDASNKILCIGGQITNSQGIWLMWYSDGNIYFSPRGTGGSGFGLTYAQSYDNNWHHYLAVYNGSSAANCKLYLDGNLVATGTGTPPASLPATTGDVFKIGALTASSIYSDGQISNCSIWNTALTSAQVTEIYSEGIPQNLLNHSAASSLVSWWQLGSNSSFNTNWTVLDEVTASGNNGTSVNMGEDAIVDGVGSYANGLSSGMGGDEVIGDAPYSTANALSVNMDVEDRVTDTPS